MGAALPIEVREALERMPAVTTAEDATALVRGLANNSLRALQSNVKGRDGDTRQAAAYVAAAGIRLVEHLDQDWP